MSDEVETTLEAVAQTIPEAPASMNVRFASQQGYDYMLTVRSFQEEGAGVALLELIPPIESKLNKLECRSIFGRGNGGKAPVDAEHPAQKECPVHAGAMMDRKEKDGQIWYSHVIGKDASGKSLYCNGKEK